MVAGFLKDGPLESLSLATGTVRSLVKSLGSLALRVDLEKWDAVELPLRALLAFSVDKRPKVRRCAQVCVEKVFKALQSSGVIKDASKVVLSMYRKYRPIGEGLKSTEQSNASKTPSNLEQMEMVHMLYVIKVIVPYLPNKVRMKILCDVSKLLGCSFSLLTPHILGLIEMLLENSKEVLVSESENILSALTLYISSANNNHVDTVISASTMLKNGLKRLYDTDPSLWIRFLPPIFTSIAGYLNSDANTSPHVEDILKESINTHINQSLFLHITNPLCNSGNEETPQVIAVMSICSEFYKLLGACDLPSEYLTRVISVLFLKLGESSYFFMKEILLKLAQKAMDIKEESPSSKHLEACIGSAVIAMGPQKVLSVIPISLLSDKLTCSNIWMIPILKKYLIGASLQYFMEHIIPLTESVKNASKKVKKASVLKGLQSCFHSLWDLLPAFCRYPTDTTKNFEALSKLLIVSLKEDPTLLETIGKALQELVNGNRSVIRNIKDAEDCVNLPVSFISNNLIMETGSFLSHYSKETASESMKSLGHNSMDLFQLLTDIFLISPPEKRTLLKGAIGCLAFVIKTENIKDIFISLLEKCEAIDDVADFINEEGQTQEGNTKERGEQASPMEERKRMRCLVMELVSSVVEAANKDLIHIFYDFIKSSLLARDGTCENVAYYTLSRILEEHHWFLSAETDDLIELIFKIRIPADRVILENRFLCFHCLLVHILKSNDVGMETKAFLILNEIITTLKTKKESRKLAYDILLKISCSLKDSQSSDAESDLQRLLNMVMGYLSSSSPHVISGAISALSLLIHNDARFCIAVPNLIASVLTLLQNKATEVIKAALGFIKVLASSLDSNDLVKLLPDIVDGISPWSSVSKYHFRSKVGIIFEILMRKCGSDAVGIMVPKKYKSFFNNVKEGRQSKKNLKGLSSSDMPLESADFVKKRGQKRSYEDAVGEKGKHCKATLNNLQKGKRKKHDTFTTNKGTSQINKRSTFANDNVPPNAERPLRSQLKGRDKKRKRNSDDKQVVDKNISKSKARNDTNRRNLNRASVVSKSNESSVSNKHRRKFGNKSPK